LRELAEGLFTDWLGVPLESYSHGAKSVRVVSDI